MSDLSTVTGIVLTVYPVGENDRRLTILTKERGKMQVFARGSRKVNNSLHAAAQPLVAGEFQVADTRNYVYLNSAEIRDYYPHIKEDLDLIYYSTYFAELAEYFTMEGQDERNILNLLSVTFSAMKKKLVGLPLIRRIFECKILQFSGMGIECFRCLSCGREEDLHSISFRAGGVFCDHCKPRLTLPDLRDLETSVLYVLRYVMSVPLTRLYSFDLTEPVFTEFAWIVKRFMEEHVPHKFRSEAMLNDFS